MSDIALQKAARGNTKRYPNTIFVLTTAPPRHPRQGPVRPPPEGTALTRCPSSAPLVPLSPNRRHRVSWSPRAAPPRRFHGGGSPVSASARYLPRAPWPASHTPPRRPEVPDPRTPPAQVHGPPQAPEGCRPPAPPASSAVPVAPVSDAAPACVPQARCP